MANNYFQFKEFIVYQDNSAMKVCTDACILGAWVADRIKNNLQPTRILDIGTGTGLLSLMIAQKSLVSIDAIEIEENAFRQARDNFWNSPWSARINALYGDVKHFSPVSQYDFIVSNPPFYFNDLLSPDKNQNYAKHNEGLQLVELIGVITKHLKASGSFTVLLPYSKTGLFEAHALNNNFFIKEKLLIRSAPHHENFRSILLFSTAKGIPLTKELIIKKEDGNYSGDFIYLMKDYYLKL